MMNTSNNDIFSTQKDFTDINILFQQDKLIDLTMQKKYIAEEVYSNSRIVRNLLIDGSIRSPCNELWYFFFTKIMPLHVDHLNTTSSFSYKSYGPSYQTIYKWALTYSSNISGFWQTLIYLQVLFWTFMTCKSSGLLKLIIYKWLWAKQYVWPFVKL